ncbi:MAG: isoleucine--tRNA ligase [cyanobacterium endosymbiont of Rhopalodia musculus]|uniref:isoleucine--tRNA ligase n=1 Tax=cyanobacterium endosymbiont of Epithemia clementina EcSB TaxID=3034674 RepID=UPI002481395F|nr:isoleucine--tRNA ligase [cyanobacterium endosymbiont of Epithemia clementina EcSB]WGT67087.1 isoleucine--tRNA ligase [cyanobacterium endosymbiont of Epithemia clementina EcSB]
MTEPKSYKNTVNLPQTDFSMRANAVKRELELQKFWSENKIYEHMSLNNPGELFILHDGPPYANGSLHMGHALNKILKDIINKYKLLRGHKVRYVPGWDCHGLPIELKVLQSMKSKERESLTPLKLRQKARDFALKTQQKQAESFKRYGIWGDWKNPYLTLTPEYEGAQVGVFGEMALKGYIYRGLKPVHWSPSSRTALAEAELEYPEGHTSQSVFAAFPVTKSSKVAQEILGPFLSNLGVAIWTTTPWTLPGNLAVALNPDLTYAVVELTSDICNYQYLIVAADLVEQLSETFETSLKVKITLQGKALEHTVYRHPLYDRESEIVIGGDYVTTESGTGLVHTAPGHGQEDYMVGQRYGLKILSPVDEQGNFTEEAGQFAGLNVLKDANRAIINELKNRGFLLKEELYIHKYPYDWRTKKPTIFRATEQWFASVEGFRKAALEAIKSVNWIPQQGENRITHMVGDRSDWCISRQRNWGVPIPVFYNEETNKPLLTEETINHVQTIFLEKGSDAWWKLSVEELLPNKYSQDAHKYRKGTDTMDVWFDSGSSWAAVAKQREELKYPADIYLEGTDQHRGWFQSSLLTSVAVNGIAPYKTVLTHGFVLDEKGYKMSKSLGNIIDPFIIINGGIDQKINPPYGADVLRLWVSSVDYSSDVLIGQNIIKQLSDTYRKIRNTTRFILGNLNDFDPEKDTVTYLELPKLDQYMLHRITDVFAEVTDAFEKFQFFRFFQTVQNFCVVDLSNFYLDIAKDRLYISHPDALRRRSCQTVLKVILENLAKAIAPVLCHMAEDIWQFLPYKTSYKSVFQSGWIELKEDWERPELRDFWEKLQLIRSEVNQVMEQARKEKAVGSSLDAKVLLYVSDQDLRKHLRLFDSNDILTSNQVDELRYLLLASQVELVDSIEDIQKTEYQSKSKLVSVGVIKADGQKCDRCWNYSTKVGEFTDNPTICERCNAALVGKF